jgi:hypothetical protein
MVVDNDKKLYGGVKYLLIVDSTESKTYHQKEN